MSPFKIETYSPIEFSKKVIFVIWLLVLSKCFILEYYIQRYTLPINSHFFIWSLSIFLVTIASFLFWNRTKSKEKSTRVIIKVRTIINLFLLLLFSSLSAFNYFLGHLPNNHIFSLLVLCFSFYLLNNGLFLNHLIQTISGILTFLSIYSLINMTTANSYLFISILLIAISIPFIIELILYRKFTLKNSADLYVKK